MINCEFEHGSKASLRHGTVDAIVLDDQERILLAKRADFLGEGGKWAIPGGFMDRDETIEEATRREVLEETGYQCGKMNLLTITSAPIRKGDDRQNITFVYIAEVGELVGTPDHESSEVKWFNWEELPPPEQMAFDHLEHIHLWHKYKLGEVSIPVIV